MDTTRGAWPTTSAIAICNQQRDTQRWLREGLRALEGLEDDALADPFYCQLIYALGGTLG